MNKIETNKQTYGLSFETDNVGTKKKKKKTLFQARWW